MFELKIKTAGDAFRDIAVVNHKGEYPLDGYGFEVRRLLNYVSGCMEAGITDGVLIDTNGNKVGEWRYE